MIGKASNAQMSPKALGITSQSSVYGSVIPAIYGRTRVPLSLIWANNLQESGGSGKKSKGKGSKKNPGQSTKTYTEAVNLLIGSNPIISPLQLWANQNDSYTLTFTSHTSVVVSGASSTVSFTDASFYCLLGVTVTTKYNESFNDYGGSGIINTSGEYERPLWNMATAGPDPTNPHGYRHWPFCFYWLPGGGASVDIPAITLGALDDHVTNPAAITVKFYYAQLNAGETTSPVGKLNLAFEYQLGNGTEYSNYPGEQILYAPFAGLGSQALDLGAGQGLPNIRAEVLGSYPLYTTGDCDFADIVEDIFKSAMAQSAYGIVPARSLFHRGLSCYEYPGMTQKKAYHSASVVSKITGPIFDLGCDTGIMIVAANAWSGWSADAGISDSALHSWIPLVPDKRSAQRQFWYALAAGSTPSITDLVALNVAGTHTDVELLELSGVDELDTSVVVQSSGAAGQYSISSSITTTNDTDQVTYILSWLFFGKATLGADQMVPRPPLNPLIEYQQSDAEKTARYACLQRSDYCIVNNSGTYEFTYDYIGGTIPTDVEWTWILVAFKASQPAGYSKPLGNMLDEDSLELCRLQCRANGLWGSLCMDSQKKAADWLKDLYIKMNAAPVWSGFKLKSIPFSEVSAVGNGAVYDAPTASGPVADLTESDFIGSANEPVVTIERKAPADTKNIMQVQHPNRASKYNDITESLPESGSVAHFGVRKDSPIVLKGVQESSIARMLLGIMVKKDLNGKF